MKCIILCGGKGMRMGGDVSPLPKPLVKVKDESLILHIIKIYLKYGVNDFILPLGYKGDLIKEYFINLKWKINNFKLTMKNNAIEIYNDNLDFNINFIDTGLNSQTGYRINQCRKLVNNEDFLLTYSDGLSDISIDKLINHHKKENKIVTVTGVNRESQFGVLEVENKLVTSFKEKEKSEEIINGGFFCCKFDVFNYLADSKDCIFEELPLKKLAKDNQLSVYHHKGFWKCIDTQKDLSDINNLSKSLWER